MKSKIIGKEGSKQIELPEAFSERIREDIAQKFFEISKEIQPYSNYPEAGKQHSASGRISHSRRKWRTAYGKGISRVPRKVLWRRGDHFYWIGAEVSGMRGGRAAHPPKIAHFLVKKKMNKKESLIAIKSAIAATASLELFKKRYTSLEKVKIELPLIISSDILSLKTKEFFAFLEKTLGDLYRIALKNKEIRCGKGKRRNRRYKENAGLLIVVGKDEKANLQGVDIRTLEELEMEDIFPLGRLTMYTEKAIEEMNEIKEDKK